METAPEPRKVLKDVSNLTHRKLVSAFPVNMEDKENADPRLKLMTKKTIEDEVIAEVKKVDLDRDSNPGPVTLQISDTSSDGFEIDEDLQLDEASDEDLSNTLPLDTNDTNEEEAPSPFLVSSLLSNKLIADEENLDNGASPMFSEPTAVRF